MDFLKRIAAALGVILAGFIIFRKRPIQIDNSEVEKNKALAEAEQVKREEIIKQGEVEKNKDVDQKDVIDFFSNRPK